MPPNKDLIVLVADKDIHLTFEALLSRHADIGIRPIQRDIFPHPHRDPGCRNHAHDFLRGYITNYGKALVVFDHEGAGREGVAAREVEDEVERLLARNGWPDGRSAVLALEPELESWVWSRSTVVARALGWNDPEPLYAHLAELGFAFGERGKPVRPKEALEHVLREKRKARDRKSVV